MSLTGKAAYTKTLSRSSGASHEGLGRLVFSIRPLLPRLRRPALTGTLLCKTGSAVWTLHHAKILFKGSQAGEIEQRTSLVTEACI